jgi:formate C-acetyltransferase
VRRAKALRYLLANRKPRIYADELIVGNISSKRIAANYYPEGASVNILEDLPRLEGKAVPLHLTGSEKKKLLSLGVWGARRSIAVRALTRWGGGSHFAQLLKPRRYIVTEEAGISHQVGNYADVVEKGLEDVDHRAACCLAEMRAENGSIATADQLAFWESLRIAIAGIRVMALRLAKECERIARAPGVCDRRRDELLGSAQACRHVPFQPARNLQEGLQACWIVHMALNLEDFEQGLSFGRLDQILDHLYQQDLKAGAHTAESAIELIASFELKTCETIPLYSERVDVGFSGNTVGQAITLGGVDAEGQDVTNELSGLFLDAYAQIRTREPNMQVRVHAHTPDWFLHKAISVVQLGCGTPALFGDAAIVRALQEAGVSEAHARDYAVIGCVELASQGRTYNSSDAALFNLPLCLELALNEGQQFVGLHGAGKRVGPRTKPVSQMQSFQDLLHAFRAQVEDAVGEMAKVIGWMEAAYKEHRTTPFNSMITRGCLESGRDVTAGGAMYDMTSVQAVGLADAGDSLYALKKLVFEDEVMSLAEFVAIIGSNFAGQEVLQTRLRKRFAHYGNGDAKADEMTALAADIYADAVGAHRNSRGGRWVPGFYSMTCGTSFGRVTGALPNGRLAGARLSNGFSPVDGADISGPTAMLRSASSLNVHRWANGGALNIKFDARTVEGELGRRALAELFRTHLVDQEGMQVQVNILDAETLRQAKADPQAFPNLLVRVSGYCAYFADLQPEVQDELIERTSHGVN